MQCQVGSLAQPWCLLQAWSSHSACHFPIRSRGLLFPLAIPSSVEQNDCNSTGEGEGGGRHFPPDGPLEEPRCNCESFPLDGTRGLELVAGLRPNADQCHDRDLIVPWASVTQYMITRTKPPGVVEHNRECLQQFTCRLTQLWQQIHQHRDHRLLK